MEQHEHYSDEYSDNRENDQSQFTSPQLNSHEASVVTIGPDELRQHRQICERIARRKENATLYEKLYIPLMFYLEESQRHQQEEERRENELQMERFNGCRFSPAVIALQIFCIFVGIYSAVLKSSISPCKVAQLASNDAVCEYNLSYGYPLCCVNPWYWLTTAFIHASSYSGPLYKEDPKVCQILTQIAFVIQVYLWIRSFLLGFRFGGLMNIERQMSSFAGPILRLTIAPYVLFEDIISNLNDWIERRRKFRESYSYRTSQQKDE